jgi:hypothetical protein
MAIRITAPPIAKTSSGMTADRAPIVPDASRTDAAAHRPDRREDDD